MEKYHRCHIQQIDQKSDEILFRELIYPVKQTRRVEDHVHGKRRDPKRPQRAAEKLIIRRNVVKGVRELSRCQ